MLIERSTLLGGQMRNSFSSDSSAEVKERSRPRKKRMLQKLLDVK